MTPFFHGGRDFRRDIVLFQRAEMDPVLPARKSQRLREQFISLREERKNLSTSQK